MMNRHELSFQRAKQWIVIRGHKTSLSLEPDFWLALKEIAAQERTPVSHLVNRIDQERQRVNLSSALRVYVLEHYRRLAERAIVKGTRV